MDAKILITVDAEVAETSQYDLSCLKNDIAFFISQQLSQANEDITVWGTTVDIVDD